MPRRSAVIGLAAWNVVVNRYLPARHYTIANLAVSALTFGAGRGAGATARQLGFGRRELGRGVRIGALAGGATAVAVFAASRAVATRAFFDDDRAGGDDVAYQVLVRIPLGTVVLEETAFRGVLPALLDGADRRAPSLRAAGWFGLWHILPTLNTLDINGVTEHRARLAAVAGGVGATALAALVLDKLRLGAGSVVTPMLAHWSANAVSYAIAARRATATPPPAGG